MRDSAFAGGRPSFVRQAFDSKRTGTAEPVPRNPHVGIGGLGVEGGTMSRALEGTDDAPADGMAGSPRKPILIDCLQFCNWSDRIFRQMREGGLDAVHATVVYHGSFRDAVHGLEEWNRLFAAHRDLIFPGRTCGDITEARRSGRTAIFLGFQNPSPIGDDLGLVGIFHSLGIRFMQLAYNNQSLLASGWKESRDSGLTLMGRKVVAEMNRLGMVVDMSHAGERSALEAIEASRVPVAVTHANPANWRETRRNLSEEVIGALAETGGMVGLSLYPHHLRGGSDCTIGEFCNMAARTAERHGAGILGIGSDLCQDRPPSALTWMREGRWSGAAEDPNAEGFPARPSWFRDNRDFGNLAKGLSAAGFDSSEVEGIMGGNWFRFLERALGKADGAT